MRFIKPERLWLKEHAELNEKWVQERIADDPSILGLGELILKDKERIQPRAGRLDLLLQDADGRRYEVEVQLGRTDETHIIRTIEYWDIERKRYPQYDHCGVLVAEDITSRFLNVISLFNSSIPLIAVQMSALKMGDDVALMFNTVLDELSRGLVDEDEGSQETTNRQYWESRVSKDTLGLVDQLVEELRKIDPKLEPTYKKFYVGLARDGVTDNFVIFSPKQAFIRLEARLPRMEEIDKKLEDAGLDVMSYTKWGRYRVRLTRADFAKHHELVIDLLKRAFEHRGS